MGKIYVGQTALKIDLDTGIDLTTGVDAVYIKYKKPKSSEVDEWLGTVEDTSHIIYLATAGEIDTEGDWLFWAYVEFTDGTFAPGEPVKQKVYLEGR